MRNLLFVSVLTLLSTSDAKAQQFVTVAGVRVSDGQNYYGHIGKAWADNASAAEETAMTECGDAGCAVLQTAEGCIATAYDGARHIYAANNWDIASAQADVMTYCSAAAGAYCTAWVTVCADGYDSSAQASAR